MLWWTTVHNGSSNLGQDALHRGAGGAFRSREKRVNASLRRYISAVFRAMIEGELFSSDRSADKLFWHSNIQGLNMRRGLLLGIPFLTAFQIVAAHGDQLKDAFEAASKKDYARAYQLFRPLAEGGNAMAQGMLGDMYRNGEGVRQDDKVAVTWWKRAAEQGEPMSQLMLGKSFIAGQGIEENFAEGARWLRKAAEQNIADAQAGLGLALFMGRGARQDKAEAAKWFLKAAEQNHTMAQAQLSRMYYNGEGGLEKSLIEANKWAIIAGDAAFPLLLPPKQFIEGSMTASQKREALHLAEQWKFDKGLNKTPPGPIGTDNTSIFL
jgi:TPR repeat protein